MGDVRIHAEQGQFLWDTVWSAGQEYGIVPAGIGVYATTGRLEKGYRLYGNELDTEYDAVEAGLSRPKVKAQDFIGKAGLFEGPRGRAGCHSVHPGGRQSCLFVWRAALHAGA